MPPTEAVLELQQAADDVRIAVAPDTGLATFAGFSRDGFKADRQQGALDQKTQALALMRRFGGAFGIADADLDLRIGELTRNPNGSQLQLDQLHDGIPVLGGGIRVYFNDFVRPTGIDSSIIAGISVDSEPTLSADAAEGVALQSSDVAVQKRDKASALFIYRDEAGFDHLVYRFPVADSGDLLVDAHTGAPVGKTGKGISQEEKFETIVVSGVDATPTLVPLANSYTDPVIVCTAAYEANTVPIVTRVSLNGGFPHTSFNVRLQNPGDQDPVVAETVTCLIMSAGSHVIDGHKVEAQSYLSTTTDRKGSWPGQVQAYLQSYSNPVVVGQVMSENDPEWSVFWDKGGSRTVPPTGSALATGKTVAEDPSSARADETVGFIVFEADHGMIGGVEFEARLGERTISGVENGPPFSYTFDTAFAAAPDVAVHSMAGVVGGDGGWSQSFASSPWTTATTLQLSVDEDQAGDSERSHGTERAAYVVFASEVVYPFEPPTGCSGSNDAECDDGIYCNGAETCNVDQCEPGTPPCLAQEICDEGLESCVTGPTLRIESGQVPTPVGDSKTTVNLAHNYASPVVICNVQYLNNMTPVVARVSNVTSSSFDVRIQSPSGAPVQPENVFYLVVEEGTWLIDGIAFEAQKYVSTITDAKNRWVGSPQTYNQSYVSPVVLGQVMSENDSDFSVYWQQGNIRSNPPSSTALTNGKTVMEDSDRTRADETIGFVVFEAVHATLLGVEMEAATGLDNVLGAANSPPYSYNLNQPFAAAPMVVLTSVAGIDGGDGAWAQSHGDPISTPTTINLSLDEDVITDSERSHTHEQVNYLAFAMPLTYPEPPEPTCAQDSDCDGFDDFCDGPDTCFNGACIKGAPPCGPGETCTNLGGGGGVCVPPEAKFETITLPSVGGQDLTPASPGFQNAPYDSPVVVCSAQYDNNTKPVVVRVDNVTPVGFDVWLQNPGDIDPVQPETVHCLVAEEGVWTIDGHMIEAQKYTSSLTDRERNWLGVARSLNHPFANPVVLGQVMSANDPRWSAYWQQGSARTSPPTATSLRNGKAVMEDPDTARLDETVGFIVFEEGHGVLAGVNFEARLGEDIVASVTGGPPFTYNFAQPFDTTPGFAVVSQAGMDGSDGSWAYLYGASPLSPTQIDVAVDEDQLFNLERGHTTEQVGYVVFEEPASFSAVIPPGALTAGQNINIVAGSNWPGGDPFLQRQNEPSGAVSSRSTMSLLVGANDYRTVDIPGLPDGKETGDAWLGTFKSYDGGNTWRSNLVPGYPQDTSPEGQASPLFGYDAGADPVLRAGAHGLFLYSGIVFDRGADAKSATFVARYMDLNNDPAGDSIRYIDTVVVESDPGGDASTGFIDKTWLAVDVPRSGQDLTAFPFETVTLNVPQGPAKTVAQQITCGNSYLTLSRILGGGTSSEVSITRSTDCGETWSEPQRISSECAISQGSTIAINPNNGDVHVAWRQFAGSPAKGLQCGTDVPTSAILATKSTDGGQTFSEPVVVANIDPFDQPSNFNNLFLSFRSNAFPTMTVDDTGRAYVAWTSRGLAADADPLAGDSRIVIATSQNGTTWTAPQVVDEPGVRGHQIQPSLTFARGKLALAYYDFREDQSGVFAPLIVDLDGTPPPTPVHTVDVRAAIADPSDMPLFTINNATPGQPSSLASKYQFILGGDDETTAELVQVDNNTTNYPLFVGGGVPFIGDYIEIFTQTMSANDDGSWTFKNGEMPVADQWHVVWADNRDVVPPPDNDWTNYKPPLSPDNPTGGGTSLYDPSQTVPVCNPADALDVQRTGMRNQNVYTTRLTQGLFTGVPSNSKPLGTVPGNPDLFQRSFVVWVQNTTDSPTFYRLTITNQPDGGQASFDQFELETTFDLVAGPDSGVARTVFVTSTDTLATINVNVQEIDSIGGAVVPGGLFNTVVLNPDPINPDPIEPSLTEEEIFNLAILNLAILNPAILNQDVENLAILNLAILNPAILNLAILNPADPNLAILNPAILNLAILNLAILNPAILNPAILNSADPNLAILNLAILNPAILNLAILNPAILNGALTDVTYTVENQGNSTAAYDFRAALNSDTDPAIKGMPNEEPPMSFSLMVYKTYSTPAVGENCELGEETVQELLVNVVNPNLDPLNIEEADASFFLAPGEEALITLRVLDHDETQGEPFKPEELEVAIESQSVNTEDLPNGEPPFALPPPSGVVAPATLAAGIGQTITIFGDPFPVAVTDMSVEFSQSPGVPGFVIQDASSTDALVVRLPASLNPGLADLKVINDLTGEGLTGAFITISETPAAPNLQELIATTADPCGAGPYTTSAPTSLTPGRYLLAPAIGIDTARSTFVFTTAEGSVAVESTCTVNDPTWGIAARVLVPALPPGSVDVQMFTTVDDVDSPLSNAITLNNFCGNALTQAEFGETCDPPGTDSGEPFECSFGCTYCGDGNVDSNEECDDGANVGNDGCGPTCAVEFCGDGIQQTVDAGASMTFPLDPVRTYLRTNMDLGSLGALPIDLAAAGFVPGDLIRIEIAGDYSNGGLDNVSTPMSAVFSSSTTLLSEVLQFRVQDAIEAGLNVTTLGTADGNAPTDIPEDFGIFTGGTLIVVPAGATHLFVSPFENSFGTNTDPNGNLEVVITPTSGEACDDGNMVDGDGCQADCSTTPGAVLLRDSDFQRVELPFSFPFCGISYDHVFVGSNGHLTFGSGSNGVFDAPGSFLFGPPMIAGLALDLDPSDGGGIVTEQISASEFEVRFINVPEARSGTSKSGARAPEKGIGANTFSFLLRDDGSYDVSYGAISAISGLAGRSAGGGLPDPGETDLTDASPTPIEFRTVYESFDTDNDLAGKLTEWNICPDFELAIPGLCYGSTGENDDGNLIVIDPTTGAGTLLGDLTASAMPGIAINSRGEIYGIEDSGDLYRIDAATGRDEFIVELQPDAFDTQCDAIDFDDADQLYCIDARTDELRTVDIVTGATTVVGPTGDALKGMAFDRSNGILYGSTGGSAASAINNDSIYTIDVATGIGTLLGATGLQASLGPAVPDLCNVDDVLYAVKGGGFNPNQFIRINKTTGAGTIVGSIGFNAVGGLAARPPQCGDGRLDFGETCDDGNLVSGDGCETTCELTSLTLADDDSVEVPIVGFEFPFCGTLYNSVHVGSNGYLTFGAPDTTAAPDIGGLLSGPPRIAGLWQDLDPSTGSISAGPVGDTFVVAYEDVEDAFGFNNTFSITLRSDGSFELDGNGVNTNEPTLVGRSPGGGASDPGETDLASAGQPIGAGLPTFYENFEGTSGGGADFFDMGRTTEFVGCFNPAVSGVCYASTGPQGGGQLLQVDPFIPSATLIGETGLTAGVPGLAINSRGEIFGTDRQTGHLYRIDAATGLATLAATIGDEAPLILGMAFDENDDLYGVSFDDNDLGIYNLRLIDIDAGSTSVIRNADVYLVGMANDPINDQMIGSDEFDDVWNVETMMLGNTVEIGATGVLTSNTTPDLCFLGDTLFGVKGGESVFPNEVIEIDTGTGAGSVVSSIPFGSVSGMASRQSCGDGSVDPGETCETPGLPAGAPNECREGLCTFCGDGVVNHGEECDDGNNVDMDGCQADCQLVSWVYFQGFGKAFNCGGPVDGMANLWNETDFDDDDPSWSAIALPDEGWFGNVSDRFYRGRFYASADGAPFTFRHQSDDGIEIFLNGTRVAEYRSCYEEGCVNGKDLWNCDEDLVAPPLDLSDWVVEGENIIAVHVTTGSGVGNFDAALTNDSSSELELALQDDDFTEVGIPFAFPFCGGNHRSMWVNSNGSISFGSGDVTLNSGSVGDLLDGPARIAGFWADLDPTAGGTISVTATPDEVAVTFDSVPAYASSDLYTFTMRLFPDGTSQVDFGTLDAPPGVVGRSTGVNATDPGEIDLSAGTSPFGVGTNTVYEAFSSVDTLDLSDSSITFAACELAVAPPGICYGSTGGADTPSGRLLAIDEATGVGTVVAETGLPRIPALAINSAGEIFATDGHVGQTLYRLDAVKGDPVVVGFMGHTIEGMTFDDNGILWGVSSTTSALVRVDPETADVTPVSANAPTGLTTGMTFDFATETLYGSSNNVDPQAIYTFDRITGDPTTIGSTGLGGSTPDMCTIGSQIYGTIGNGIMSELRDFVTIDKVTGAASVVGNSGFRGLAGLATRVPSCGDGVVDVVIEEECDDGNDVDGDGCENCMFTPLPLGDDDVIQLPMTFNFPFCGVEYDTIYVGSNGYVTFGSGDTDGTPTVAEFLSGPPRIAGFWTDLDPSSGGEVTWDAGGGGAPAVVTYTNVPLSGTTDTVTFSITLNSNGTVSMSHGGSSIDSAFVGRTAGGGAADPGETDLSMATQPLGPGQVSLYEWFAGATDAFDLTGATLLAACWNPATPNVCYATRGRNGQELLSIDVETGVGSLVVNTGLTDGTPGLAINAQGEMFATGRDTGALYRIDPVTGLTQYIGETGTASGGFGLFSGIAFDENGVLYGSTSDGSLLQTINTETAATTTVGPMIGTGFDHIAGLAFDPSDGTLYGGTPSGSQFSPRFDGVLTVDTTKGLAKLIGPTGLSGTTLPNPLGGNINLGQRITDLCFVDGELYGSKGGGSQSDNPFVHIDTSVEGGFVLAYANDFEAGGPTMAPGVTGVLSGETTVVAVPAGFEGLGELSGNFLHNATGTSDPPQMSTVLTLNNLPPHEALRINLTLATINNWTGRQFRVRVDGQQVFGEFFHNTNAGSQSYPPYGSVQLTTRPFADLGSPLGGAPAPDGVYDLSYDVLTATSFEPYSFIPSIIRVDHSASSATIEFDVPGASWTGGATQSWGMDGLRVELVSEPTGTVVGLIGYSSVSGMATRYPSCGDGHVDYDIGESCDDGNRVNGDGCNDCTIALADDDFIEVPLPFDFPFCGTAYDSVFVNSNGTLTFGAGDALDPPGIGGVAQVMTDAFLAGPPRISAIWLDYDPSNGGSIAVQRIGDDFEISYNVPEGVGSDFSNFRYLLRPDGTYLIDYTNLDIGQDGGISGRSRGNNLDSDPGETDLSAAPQPIGGGTRTIYERFEPIGGSDMNGLFEYATCPGIV